VLGCFWILFSKTLIKLKKVLVEGGVLTPKKPPWSDYSEFYSYFLFSGQKLGKIEQKLRKVEQNGQKILSGLASSIPLLSATFLTPKPDHNSAFKYLILLKIKYAGYTK